MEPTSPKVLRRAPERKIRHALRSRGQAFEDARKMGYDPHERHVLFALRIEEAMATVHENGRPKRSRWEGASPTPGTAPPRASR